MTQTDKSREEAKKKRNARMRGEAKPIVPNAHGKSFVQGTHVEFVFHRHKYTGKVAKQLNNSAIVVFDPRFSHTMTAAELKQKVVISYTKMRKITE
ncbi:hypothetical protein [Ligilactobacillus saerimneri]|uniref:Uncharacterized protein n=2 Tax=Ligilactobacillus saerimneri TaxID=228229 RepID=M5J6M0_9LACO|nr:hypothetical protein D271_05065 [Ligilactobacillus saerimneri 30a]